MCSGSNMPMVTSVFSVTVIALFIIVRNWKQSKSLSIGEWKLMMVYPYNGILLSKKKGRNY